MNYADIITCTTVDGIGVRVSLYVTGCRNRCPGCFNSDLWAFDRGIPYTWETKEFILGQLRRRHIDGLSILGGEPFEPENQCVLVDLVYQARYLMPEKTIWIYSGYTLEQLMSPGVHPHGDVTDEILGLCDFLVDGKFDRDQKDPLLRFRGSRNQRVIDLKSTRAEGKIVIALT